MTEQPKKLVYEEDVNKIIEMLMKNLSIAGQLYIKNINQDDLKQELNDFLSSFADEIEEGYGESLDKEPPEDHRSEVYD